MIIFKFKDLLGFIEFNSGLYLWLRVIIIKDIK